MTALPSPQGHASGTDGSNQLRGSLAFMKSQSAVVAVLLALALAPAALAAKPKPQTPAAPPPPAPPTDADMRTPDPQDLLVIETT